MKEFTYIPSIKNQIIFMVEKGDIRGIPHLLDNLIDAAQKEGFEKAICHFYNLIDMAQKEGLEKAIGYFDNLIDMTQKEGVDNEKND